MRERNDPSAGLKHRRLVEDLAEETRQPIHDVERIYSGVLEDLKETAGVVDYVPIFAWRRARKMLMKT